MNNVITRTTEIGFLEDAEAIDDEISALVADMTELRQKILSGPTLWTCGERAYVTFTAQQLGEPRSPSVWIL